MEFRLPEYGDEAALREYVREHHAAGESSISASFGLSQTDYIAWVGQMVDNALTGAPDRGRALLYVCVVNGRIAGLLSIRYELSQELAEKYGHIGYGVRPSERRKGYATRMVAEALAVCREKGMRRVILGCYADNRASAGVIEKCGGRLIAENDNYQKGRLSRYYSIDL